jgi:hypothetical protein
MQHFRKAPLRAGARSQVPAASADPAPRGRRVLLGIAFGKGASAKAAATAHAKAAHLLALTVDHGLVAAGVAAAVGSASFAGFMIARDNSHRLFGGIEHLMIFAQPIGAAGSHRRLLLEQASAPPDDDATGSIASPLPRADAERARPARDAGAADDDQPEPAGRPAKGYVLRFTRKGAIVVEGPKGSFAAVPGVVLPDRGRILSIENRNGRWVVLTENGMVTEPAP